MVHRSRKSPEGNPRFAREDAPWLDSSKTAMAVASNFGSPVDQNLAVQPLDPVRTRARQRLVKGPPNTAPRTSQRDTLGDRTEPLVFRPRQSNEEDQRSPREQTSRSGSSNIAPGAASNFDSAVDPDLAGQPLKPLAVSVRTAAALLGVGRTTIWSLIATRRVEVIRIGRRTLATMSSLEALVASASAPSRQPLDGAP